MTESVSCFVLPVDADADGDGGGDVVGRNGCTKPWFFLGSGNGVVEEWRSDGGVTGIGTGIGVVVEGGVGVGVGGFDLMKGEYIAPVIAREDGVRKKGLRRSNTLPNA